MDYEIDKYLEEEEARQNAGLELLIRTMFSKCLKGTSIRHY